MEGGRDGWMDGWADGWMDGWRDRQNDTRVKVLIKDSHHPYWKLDLP